MTCAISIHAPRAGCDDPRAWYCPDCRAISIHAPRAGCDQDEDGNTLTARYFNPRTPCGVRPAVGAVPYKHRCRFQSTHPVRGATLARPVNVLHGLNFNPRTPCGVRPVHGPGPFDGTQDFNPRTPCGVRRFFTSKLSSTIRFQSTHPVRGATMSQATYSSARQFQSTHPVRGATTSPWPTARWSIYFNPRTPCGVRRQSFLY